MNNNVMMKSLALFCALSLLISALPAYAAQGAGMEAFVRAVHEQMLRNWPHMDKAWPGLNYNQHPFILFYVDDELLVNEAWLLNTQGVRKLDEKEYQGIAVPQPDGYSELRFDGKPGLAMSVDDYSLSQPRAQEETYRTATHEMVHFYYQPPQGEMAGSRAQVYPLDAQPRLYRAMIYQHLIAAFENPAQRDEHLGKARYWLNLWGKGTKRSARRLQARTSLRAPPNISRT
ncbi:MAG: hypothetical protein GXZ04_00025 [Clostridiales bacterium]|nr:hypothetical protein [Clostridiales bacterium]